MKLKRLLKNIVLPLSQRQTPAGELVTTPAAETAAVRWKSLLAVALCAVGLAAFAEPAAKLTRMPMAVKNVKVQQRYPWNGLVDVNFDLMGEGSVKVKVLVTVDGVKLAKPTVTGETKFDLGTGGEVKGLKLTWDAKADFGDAEKHEKIKVKLSVSPVEPD